MWWHCVLLLCVVISISFWFLCRVLVMLSLCMLLLLVFARFGCSCWVGSWSLDVRLFMVERPKSWRLQLQPISLVGKRIVSLIQPTFGPPNWCFHGLLARVGCVLASSLARSSATLQGTLFPGHCWFLVLLADHSLLVCSFLYVYCRLALIFVQGSMFPWCYCKLILI
jgi:hypothetical protein